MITSRCAVSSAIGPRYPEAALFRGAFVVTSTTAARFLRRRLTFRSGRVSLAPVARVDLGIAWCAKEPEPLAAERLRDEPLVAYVASDHR